MFYIEDLCNAYFDCLISAHKRYRPHDWSTVKCRDVVAAAYFISNFRFYLNSLSKKYKRSLQDVKPKRVQSKIVVLKMRLFDDSFFA